jgi:hypothetical protein
MTRNDADVEGIQNEQHGEKSAQFVIGPLTRVQPRQLSKEGYSLA